MEKNNYYDLLNVKRDSNADDIKQSYLKLSKKIHPDKNNNTKESNQAFINLREAYSTLINPLKRQKYDQLLMKKSHNERNFNGHMYTNHDFGKYESQGYNNYCHYHRSRRTNNSSYSGNGRFVLRHAITYQFAGLATLFLFYLVGGGIHLSLCQKSAQKYRENRDTRSRVLAMLEEYSRETAKELGKEEVMDRIEKKTMKLPSYNEFLELHLKQKSRDKSQR